MFKGFYGYSDKTSLSEGDIFNVHFVKKSTVVFLICKLTLDLLSSAIGGEHC